MDKLLNQFLAVAEAGTISAAATALFVTQPTLTFNMRKLEENLGVKLLIRTPRGAVTLPSACLQSDPILLPAWAPAGGAVDDRGGPS